METELVEQAARVVRVEEDGEAISMSMMRGIRQTLAEFQIQRTSLGA